MKKIHLTFIFSLAIVLSHAQEYQKIIHMPDSISFAEFIELKPEIDEINRYLSAKDEKNSPDYKVWPEGNSKLQNFVSNQDINLWNGNYIRPTALHSLFAEHKHRVVVNIKYPWMDTGIDLDKDKQYYMVASGLASTSNSKLALWIGPEGKEYTLNSLPMYSIIGKIGETSEPFYKGKEIEIQPSDRNRLYLGYNDDLFMDNIGYYIVDIFELTKKETLEKLNSIDMKLGTYYAE